MTIHEFQLIYNSYYPVAFNHCLHFNLQKEELEDVIMNVFAKILCDLNKYRVQGIKSFIVTSARNECTDIVRRNKLKQHHLRTLSEEVHDIREQIEKTDVRESVMSIIGHLPPQQQRVLELKYIYDQTREEIAENLKLSPNTIRNTLADAMKKIRKRLNKNGPI